jgi:hypothetical protein
MPSAAAALTDFAEVKAVLDRTGALAYAQTRPTLKRIAPRSACTDWPILRTGKSARMTSFAAQRTY